MHYKLAIDVMGGDAGPSVTVPAALLAIREEPQLHITLVGDANKIQEQINHHLSGINKEESRVTVHATSQVVEMNDKLGVALRKEGSSMRVAIDLVRDGKVHACISAGNTGALMAMACLVLKTLPGIERPAISTVLPTVKRQAKVRVLDLGANVDSRAHHLFQFAVMGSVLSSEIDGLKNPRVGLLNIGSEEIKGSEQVKEAAKLLRASQLNYIGYVEGDAIYQGIADVIVCDGFVGNVALKVTEGVAKLIASSISISFNRNIFSRLSGLIASPILKGLRRQLDPAYYNGASLVGLKGIVIKSHGSADTLGFYHAIKEAIIEVKENIPERIQKRVACLLQETNQSAI